MINYELLQSEAEKIGVDLGEYGADRFDSYAERLVRWNEHVNLTAITEPDDIVIKHFIDCLYIMKYVAFKKDEKLVDVGTGAGFPGMPLLIANPDLDVTFVDSMEKRIGFLRDVLKNIGLTGTRIHERAEIVGKDADYREKFDYATARAVAPLNVLCEYCLPLVKVGGLFVSLKGSSGMEELKAAENAINVLGGEIAKAVEYQLPNGDGRSIIIIRKISQTPTKYPRKSKKIDTKPL
ncbi:MAG: 16S rRNA (guanine(527)-N(7))-methyltransferase RsmG [Eubacteriales bacterium]|nr:16S rRNA (guanine(527)-N(7))-methyltransferase RsmG [Eubacteriales bacterium]